MSCMTVTEDVRSRLASAHDMNASLNCFITIDDDGALAAAAAADQRRADNDSLGPFDGAVIAVKDNVDTAGLLTTFGSKMYSARVPEHDAAAISRLRAAGAIVLGKTNMTELACGTTGVNEHFGTCRNPGDTLRYPGGSSSGSAAAVAAGIVDYAIGSDTGCSIRHPASVCGVVGLKPTYDRVSRMGVSVCAERLDHVGPIASSVTAAASMLRAMQEPGNDDPEQLIGIPSEGRKVALLTGEHMEACAHDVQLAFADVGDMLRRCGFEVGEIDLEIDLAGIDDAANDLGADLFRLYGDDIAAAGPGGVGEELLEWNRMYIDVDDVRYQRALEIQASVTNHALVAMDGWDAVVCPTTRVGAGLFSETADEDRRLRMGNCSLWNMTGQPSITIPHGTSTVHMPLGVMITGHHHADAVVLQIAKRLESV